jgi:hypothetical protein
MHLKRAFKTNTRHYLTYTMKGNPLKWTMNPNPNLPFVEALTQKWRYEVHADVSIDGHWAAHREFRHPALRSWLIAIYGKTLSRRRGSLSAEESWHVPYRTRRIMIHDKSAATG